MNTNQNCKSPLIEAMPVGSVQRINPGSLRGKALSTVLAELDSPLVYEVRLEVRLAEVLNHNPAVVAG